MQTRRAVLTTLGGLSVIGAVGGLYGFWIEPAYRLAIANTGSTRPTGGRASR